MDSQPGWRWAIFALVVSVVIGLAGIYLTLYPEDGQELLDGVRNIEKSQCWDGEIVTTGTPCSDAYNLETLYWAFNLDQVENRCEGGVDVYGTTHARADDQCDPVNPGSNVHIAIWNSVADRDLRATHYGSCRVVDASVPSLRCDGASETSTMIRYDSDGILLYASAEDENLEDLEYLLERMRTADELLYGVKVTR